MNTENAKKAELSPIEVEVVRLKATQELIDLMVNPSLCVLKGTDPESEVQFKSSTHMSLFNIVLVDFLSCTAKKSIVPQESYLQGLRIICKYPSFNVDRSVDGLSEAVHAFTRWLEEEVTVENVWLPSISRETTLRLPRFKFLKMCGNTCKHNFLRLTEVAKDLTKVLSEDGVEIGQADALLVLGDFHDRFHRDILGYHASTISEFLNNLRWGIHDYLQPELRRAEEIERGDPRKYRYEAPPEVTSTFAQSCYCELMNEVSHPPCMRRFTVTRWLKLRY